MCGRANASSAHQRLPELHVPQLSCPVRKAWPAIVELGPAGCRLALFWLGGRVGGKPSLVASCSPGREGCRLALFWLRASRARSRGPKDGTAQPNLEHSKAARAILEAGGSFAHLSRSGQWHSSAFHLPLDLGRQETQAMASIPIRASGEAHLLSVAPTCHGYLRRGQVTESVLQASVLVSGSCCRFGRDWGRQTRDTSFPWPPLVTDTWGGCR